MLNFKRAASLSICALVLTACGGHDGDKHNMIHDGADHDSGSNLPVDHVYSAGAYVAQEKKGELVSIKPKFVKTGKNLDNIIIDNNILDISDAHGYKSGNFIKTRSANKESYIGGKNRLSFTRFGISTLEGVPTELDNQFVSFFAGQELPSDLMPSTGSAIYNGDAIYWDADNTRYGWGRGEAVFNVFYASKFISGKIKFDDNVYSEDLIELSGKIHGSSFSGEKNGVEMNGKFFGPDAAELGGVFYKNNEMLGAFGAKK